MHPAAASLAALALGATAIWGATDGLQALTAEGARRLAAARDAPRMPAVTVETMTGQPLALPAAGGRAEVIEFVYTTCPTICRTGGDEMARLRDRLREAGLAGQVRLVSLSFDPETDTRALLADYGARHGADGRIWTVARPDPADLPRLLRAYGVTVIPDGWGGYEHNIVLHVVAPDGRLSAILDIDDLDGAEAAIRAVLR